MNRIGVIALSGVFRARSIDLRNSLARSRAAGFFGHSSPSAASFLVSGLVEPSHPRQTRSRSIEAARDFPCDTDNLLGDGFPSCALLSESRSHYPIAARYYTPLGPVLQFRATPAEAGVFSEAHCPILFLLWWIPPVTNGKPFAVRANLEPDQSGGLGHTAANSKTKGKRASNTPLRGFYERFQTGLVFRLGHYENPASVGYKCNAY